jgi:hypothetical protein
MVKINSQNLSVLLGSFALASCTTQQHVEHSTPKWNTYKPNVQVLFDAGIGVGLHKQGENTLSLGERNGEYFLQGVCSIDEGKFYFERNPVHLPAYRVFTSKNGDVLSTRQPELSLEKLKLLRDYEENCLENFILSFKK